MDRECFIEGSKGQKLYVKVTDSDTLDDGKPIVLVVPGGPGLDHKFYHAHIDFLRAKAHLVYFDPYGTGKSDRSKKPEDYSMETHVQDIEAIRKALPKNFPGIDCENLTLLGTSYGGMCALKYATMEGLKEHLAGLILVSTAHTHKCFEDADEILEEKGDGPQKILGAKLFGGEFTDNQEVLEFFNRFSSLYYQKAKTNPVPKPFCEYEPLNYAFKSKLQGFDLTDEALAGIECKTLILGGEDDWICPPKYARHMAHKIPGCEFAIFPGCGHGVARDVPKQYRQSLLSFIYGVTCKLQHASDSEQASRTSKHATDWDSIDVSLGETELDPIEFSTR